VTPEHRAGAQLGESSTIGVANDSSFKSPVALAPTYVLSSWRWGTLTELFERLLSAGSVRLSRKKRALNQRDARLRVERGVVVDVDLGQRVDVC